MADNTTLNPGVGGDTIREVEKAGAKAQVVLLDIGGLGAESLLTGTLPVSAASLPLPAGASTAARQDTGNTSVASIDTKMPVQGQAVAAASVPVVLTAVQIATLTPLTTIAITAASLPLPANAAQESGGNLASINTSNAPFLVPAAGGYIRQDSTATIAKESGGNLSALASVLGTTADAEVRTDVDGTIASRLLSMSVQLQELIDQQKNTNAFLFRLAFANRVSNGERVLKKV